MELNVNKAMTNVVWSSRTGAPSFPVLSLSYVALVESPSTGNSRCEILKIIETFDDNFVIFKDETHRII